VIETKGQENIDVAHKDLAATIWCENATLLTDITWTYVKVPQVEFGKLQPGELADVSLTFGGSSTIGNGAET
jgi:type III restriction enzyme